MKRNGITMIELLVALGVIALLMALLLPAVQMAREFARSGQCKSNLRQIGLALQNYESIHGMWPAGCFSYNTSWQVAILPQIDQSPLFQQVNFSPARGASPADAVADVSVPLYLCPSDSAPAVFSATVTFAATNYLANSGTGLLVNGYDGMFCHMQSRSSQQYPEGQIRIADVTDGTSTTAAVSEVLHSDNRSKERLRAVWNTPHAYSAAEIISFQSVCSSIPSDPDPAGWRGSLIAHGLKWIFGEIGYSTYNHMLTPMQPSCFNGTSVQEGIYSVASGHKDATNVLFADGHVQPVSAAIDRTIWSAIGSRNGSEFVQP